MNLALIFAEWGDKTLVYLRGLSWDRTQYEHGVNSLRQAGFSAEVVSIAPQAYDAIIAPKSLLHIRVRKLLLTLMRSERSKLTYKPCTDPRHVLGSHAGYLISKWAKYETSRLRVYPKAALYRCCEQVLLSD